MKAPNPPPDTSKFYEKLPNLQENPQEFTRFMSVAMSLDSQGEYLHWDKLRFKPLPQFLPENVTLEEYWHAIKFNRATSSKPLPFVPKDKEDIPFSFCRPDCLLADLRHIDIKAGGMVSTGHEAIGHEDSQRYLTRSILEEPFSSSVLEGAATTRLKAQALIEQGEKPLTKDDRMVLNNYKAMMFIKEHIDSDLTPAIILECHKIITDGTLDRPEMAGQLRDNNDIVVGDEYGEIFHEPPNFTELEKRLQTLCEFANAGEGENSLYIHPITRAIILHFILAYDHPFIDGNGRTARALFYWSALRSGYWIIEYISISKIIKNAQVKYGKAFLYTETDDNDVTYFIMHQLDVIKRAIAELEKYLDRQKTKYKNTENLLSAETLNHRQKHLLTELIRKRVFVITIDKHQRLHDVSYLTARKDLDDLRKDKWLTKKNVGRKYYYYPGRALENLQNQQTN
ncbi:MAG: filamentation induced by cAMP protein fic [Robiginitomaculum sp.]|nr:MAG: filamentation induced by cAMP protein fic [Robiginitomaculum sp.]